MNINKLILLGVATLPLLASAEGASTITKGKPAIPYKTKTFITFGRNTGDLEDVSSNISSTAGLFNYFGKYGVQISSLGLSQGEQWSGSDAYRYIENTSSFRFGANYELNPFVYPYVELGYAKTSTDGVGESGTHKYFTGEAGVYLRPIDFVTLSVGYHFSDNPDEVRSLNGLGIRAGLAF